MKRLSMLVLLISMAPAQAQDAAAQKVIDCIRANVPDAVRVDDLALDSFDPQGATQKLKGRLYVTKEKSAAGPAMMHTMLRLDTPAQLKGAAYLVRQTDDFLRDGMFVYLPSVGRVRRVTGSFADGAMLGTAFSYYDFKQYTGAFGDLDPALEKPETIEQRAVSVVSFKALPGSETHYSGVRAWIDQKTCVPLKAEFYENGAARKRVSVAPAALKQSNGYWYPAEAEVVDLQNGARTVVRMDKVNSGESIPTRYFDQTSFFLGQ